MRVLSEYINNDFKPFSINETVAEIQDFFAESTFSHFPILNEGIYQGCISSVDAETFEKEAMTKISLPNTIIPRYRSTYFNHIFVKISSSFFNYYSNTYLFTIFFYNFW